jgi:DNA-binding CsgD family transcriptional regulator/tetratricopeptide (TPR) repeat protein
VVDERGRRVVQQVRVVHHLATTGTAFVVATVRSGEAAPDAVSALWKDGAAEWLELRPLSETDLGLLVESVVGGPVDAATRHRLMSMSMGNALFLRELVTGAVDSGALVESDGLWRARGPLPASGRLVEVVQARLGRLAPEVRAAAEVVAVAEPIGAALLELLVPAEELEATDRAGLLSIVPDARRTLVRLAHPLYGELLRATITPLRARSIPRRLAAVLASTGARRRDDLLRLAVWQLEGGAAPDPQVLVPAARRALKVFFDPPLAERLATAAVKADGGFPACLAQAEALSAQGRPAQAERLFRELEALAPSADDRTRLALLRADNLLGGLGRSAEARALLDRAADTTTSRRWHDEIDALRVNAAMIEGCAEEAAEASARVLAGSDTRPWVALRALAGLAAAAAYRGRTEDAVAAAERGRALMGGAYADVSLALDRLLTVLCLAYRLAGRYDDADALSGPRSSAALERRADDVRAAWAIEIGEVALARGRVETAVRCLREAAVELPEHLRAFGSHGLSWCLGVLAQAAAVAGRLDVAEQALAQADANTPASHYVPSLRLGRAWVAAARGDVAAGRAIALEAARAARERDAEAFEAEALHEAARLGGADAVAGRLRALAAQVEGPLAPCYAAHAEALVAADAAALEAVGARCEELGALLLAAECAASAARLHWDAGRGASARAAAGRARTLAARCGSPRTPGLALPNDSPELTPRERQIAQRARTMSSRAIADELSLSVRTVENHLRHVYAKLGITRREELRDVL